MESKKHALGDIFKNLVGWCGTPYPHRSPSPGQKPIAAFDVGGVIINGQPIKAGSAHDVQKDDDVALSLLSF